MRYLDLTLPSLAENLALEEALLEEAETAAAPLETLRIWEAVRLGVVVGRSSRVDVEVRAADCREAGVRVLRRISGGAAVVVGPGCLMYALVLSLRLRPNLRSIDQAHAGVLGTIAAALRQALVVPPLGGCPPNAVSQDSIRLKPVLRAPEIARPRHVRPGGRRKKSIRQQRPLPSRVPALSRHAAVRLSSGTNRPISGHAAAAAGISPLAPARGVRDEPAARRGRAPQRAAVCVEGGRNPRAMAASGDREARWGEILTAASGTNNCRSAQIVVE